MYNILETPMIRTLVDGSPHEATLPQILAWLSGPHEIVFQALRPHQHHPWFAFLVQVAALAAHHGSLKGLPTDPELWRMALVKLTKGRLEPWSLVVHDPTTPALLQPPLPKGTLETFNNGHRTPDEMDITRTAKNFDIKQAQVSQARPEHWIFALVALQTAEGALGRGNYGIVRMNKGNSSRPCVSFVPSLSWSARFQQDVGLWLKNRKKIVDLRGYSQTGIALLWLVPWDGTTKLQMDELDPFFIEICRRIRLVEDAGKIQALRGNSAGTRIDAQSTQGVTGDIWTPTMLDPKGPKSLTISGHGGLPYPYLVEGLFAGKWSFPVGRGNESTRYLLIQVLERAQGKTMGYHEKVIPYSTILEEELGHLAIQRVDLVSKVKTKMLRPALFALFNGDKKYTKDPRIEPWSQSFERMVDDVFFTMLFEDVTKSEEEAERSWRSWLQTAVGQVLEEAKTSTSIPLARRFLHRAVADYRFRGGMMQIPNFDQGTPCPNPTPLD